MQRRETVLTLFVFRSAVTVLVVCAMFSAAHAASVEALT